MNKSLKRVSPFFSLCVCCCCSSSSPPPSVLLCTDKVAARGMMMTGRARSTFRIGWLRGYFHPRLRKKKEKSNKKERWAVVGVVVGHPIRVSPSPHIKEYPHHMVKDICTS